MRDLADRRTAWKVLSAQSLLTLSIAGILWWAGPTHVPSAVAGGAIATLANALFSLRVFVAYRAQEPGRLLARFYGAELQRFLLTGALFAGAIKWLDPLSIGALLGVYLLVHVAPSFLLWKVV